MTTMNPDCGCAKVRYCGWLTTVEWCGEHRGEPGQFKTPDEQKESVDIAKAFEDGFEDVHYCEYLVHNKRVCPARATHRGPLGLWFCDEHDRPPD